MGKQLSIYLNESEARRLAEMAGSRCRRPHDQARYILLSALGFVDRDDEINIACSSRTEECQQSEALVT